MELNKKLFTIEEFIESKNDLANQIKDSGVKYDLLLGNLRGGFYLCDALSRDLGIPYQLIRISHRDSKDLDVSNILPLEILPDKKYLFVDDLIDSGETISQFENLSNVEYCVLLKKENHQTKNFCLFSKNLEDNVWIDFFWETY